MASILLTALFLPLITALPPHTVYPVSTTAAPSSPAHPIPTVAPSPLALSTWVNYTSVPGFFLQDDLSTNASTFDYTTVNFGLINRTYSTDTACGEVLSQWQRFEIYVNSLNARSGRDIDYKVLFMGRHGQGYHNAAETYYGTPAWNCYYSELDGNGTVTWADAHLTPTGIEQAQVAADFWLSRITTQKIPLPQSYYTSPLSRCLETCNITFSTLPLPPDKSFIPTIKELFRESISGHTCDRRSNKTYIHNSFPSYKIEAGFSEQDLLWKPLVGETSIDQELRSKVVIDQVFKDDSNTWLSITSHSGEIGSILEVLNHRVFSLNTGAVIPVLVKAQTISGTVAPTSTQAWTSLSTCTSPPANTATL